MAEITAAPDTAPPKKHASSLAPFNPTCDQALATTLKMLELTDKDVLFDLGCGDARSLMHAAQNTPGLRCVGIELDPIFVQRGRQALKELPEDVQRRVDIRRGDLLQLLKEVQGENCQENGAEHDNSLEDEEYQKSSLGIDCRDLTLFKDATALYMFLLPKGIQKIQGLLDALAEPRQRPFRVVAYMFSIRKWEPVMVDKTTKGDAPLYLYKFGPEEDKGAEGG